ncbi:hypothetical protein ACRE_091220 [Hapsidospora chrysogenum ATCC 11550]|uniref:Uncharacterized protein n=1 Tax=Hapsidospora chrysogenum (strain ATCC 11550 / CBS 779.69 / DSM 880 / IAM 14645 / JCM 23072 / IMI 49137) TaxID=857340 RepID=A0A086SSY9_HAPC1|nr:hypothetical protein ACRE_091220 [Hapsidospora chrysogenum ATCC 11550]
MSITRSPPGGPPPTLQPGRSSLTTALSPTPRLVGLRRRHDEMEEESDGVEEVEWSTGRR